MGLRSSKLLVTLFLASSCVPTKRQSYQVGERDAGGPPPIEVEGGPDEGDAPTLRPHAILSITPPHGPFSGGTLASIRGNGFGSDAQVWFGDVLVPKEQTIVVDPQRIQLTTPEGAPGPADVIVQNGDDESTRVTLPGGFSYDDLFVTPLTGPTSGGTLVTIHAYEPLFDEDTEIEIDLQPCDIEEIVSPTELTCLTPPGTPGTKTLRASVKDDGESRVFDVLDGYTYVVSDDSFRGGFSGDALAGELDVLVLSDTGEPSAIPGATVIVGNDADSARVTKTDGFGTAVISDSEFDETVTVTVARKCFQPFTYVGVPVERVTVYLQPVLSPACGDEGQPPAGRPGTGARVSGEIVWPLDEELREAGWENVPTPHGENSVKIGYVFRLAPRATDEYENLFNNPVGVITPTSSGEVGYSFYFSTLPGNFAVYALVGIEDRSRSPYTFTPYAMGLTRGVAVAPDQTREEVYIQIDTPLDHTLLIDATGPTPTSRGPDHIEARLAIEVGNEGYILLPNGRLTSLLPAPGPFRFVGVPPLNGSLTGSRYIATATAMTGTSGGPPLSAVGLFATVTGLEPLGVGSFLEVPRVDAPASSAKWNGREFELGREPGGPKPSLTVLDVASGGGLISWRIVAPGSPETVRVPDLAAIDPELALVKGAIAVQVTLAHIDDFEYRDLKTPNLTTRTWRSYSRDVSYASY
ncbi:MAG TPA: IPT/TIG domain-containing protein [Polyangiaceae bacterium]